MEDWPLLVGLKHWVSQGSILGFGVSRPKVQNFTLKLILDPNHEIASC
jgi:hypothetical protein